MSSALALTQLYMSYWGASAILAAANLGIADALDREPRDVGELARALGLDEECLFRLLRGLAAIGVFREQSPRRFAHTPLSEALRSDAPGDVRATIRMFGLRSTRQAMAEYEHAIRTGGSTFELVHGDPDPFAVLAARPDEAAVYHEAMSLDRGAAEGILGAVDFGAIATLVDVGGGRGTLLARILSEYPAQRGVLFDVPEVVAGARATLDAAGVTTRCEVRGGDLRREVPAGGDGYILKNILHGWPDEDCAALLARIRDAAAAGARLFIIENVMPEGNAPSFAKTFDLFLLLGGRRSKVRTQREFEALLAASGFALVAVTPYYGPQAVVEARRC